MRLLSALLLAALPAMQAAAQTTQRAYSLDSSVSQASVAQLRGGVQMVLTAQNASFIGWDAAGPVQLNQFHPTYFGSGGDPTALFRSGITFPGGPAGLEVSSVSIDPRIEGGSNGIAADEYYRTVRVTVRYTGAPLTTDVDFRISVDESLLNFVDSSTGGLQNHLNSGTVSGQGDLSFPFKATAESASADPLLITGAPLSITEGGAAGSYRVALRSDPGSGVSVVVTPGSSDTGAATVSTENSNNTLTFTGGNTGTWQTPQTVTVTPVDDDDRSEEKLQIDHSITGISATKGGVVLVTVTDDDRPEVLVTPTDLTFYRGSGETSGSYNVKLSAEPGMAVDVLPTVTNSRFASVTGPTSGGVVKITLNSSNWQAGADFQVAAGNLSAGQAGKTTITHEVESRDLEFDDLPAPSVTVETFGGNRPVTGGGDLLVMNPSSFIMDEDETATYTVTYRADPGENVTRTVTVTTVLPGPATPETIGISPTTLTFTGGASGNWNRPQTVTLTPIADHDSSNESITVYHFDSSNGNLFHEVDVFVNDTVVAGVVLSRSSVALTEVDQPASYTVRLATRPVPVVDSQTGISESGSVSVIVNRSSDSDSAISLWGNEQVDNLAVTRHTMTFDETNWNVPKTVRVIAQGSTTAATAKFTHTTRSTFTETAYQSSAGLSKDLTVTFTPTNEPRAVLTVTPTDVSEGGSVTVGVNLTDGIAPTSARIIPFVYTNGSAEGADYTSLASVRVPANQRTASGTVTITDDDLNEGAETFTVSLGTLPNGVQSPRSSETSSVEVTIAASDTPELSIAADAASVNEGGSAGFTLTASNAADQDITVSVSVSETGGYVDAGDRGAQSLTLTAGTTTIDFDVDTSDLSTDDLNGSVSVTVNSGTGYTVKSDASSASQEIIDGDPTTVTLAAPAGNISETGGSKTISVTLGRALVDGEALSLPLTIGGSAVLGADYSIAEPGDPVPTGVSYANLNSAPAVTFTGGSTPSATVATLIVSATGDANDEGASESISVDLPTLDDTSGTNLDGGASGSGSVSFAIEDDDDEPTVSVTGPSGPLDEGDTATFTLSVSGQSQQALTIGFSVAQEGAFVAAGDLGVKSLALSPGTASLTHEVEILSDSDDEPSGSLTISLNTGTGYAVDQSAASVTVDVVDNDATGVELSADPAGNISETSGAKTITVEIDRGLVDGEILALPLDVGGTATLGTDYTLAAPNSAPTGVTYATLNSAPTITFTGPGSGATATSATLTLSATSDLFDEPATETITIELPDLDDESGTNLDAGASGTGSVSFSITDDDATPEISLTRVGSGGVTEGTSANFRLTASNPSASDLSLGLNLTQSGQFLASSVLGAQSLKLTSGQTTLDYQVNTVSDLNDEVSGSFTIALATGAGYTVHASNNSHTVAVADDDATLVTLDVPSSDILETGGSQTITVTLARALVSGESLPVEVKFAGTATFGTDYTLAAPSPTPTGVTYGTLASTTTITFTGGSSAATSATLSVNATGDSLNEGTSESVSVSLGTLTASSGTGLAGGARGSGSGSFAINDDDGAAEVSIAAVGDVTEGSDARFTVASTTASATAVTVNLNVTATGAFVASGATGSNKSVVIPANQTSASYTVATQSDTTDEVGGSVTVAVASGTGYTVSSSAGSATVEVSDDDPTSVTLAATDTTAEEDNSDETATLTVTLGRALVSGESLVVPLAVSGVATAEYSLELTAASGIAFAPATNTLTFTGGAGAVSAATLTFSASDETDASDYANEAVTVSIPSSSSSGTPRLTATGLDGGASGSGSATITITDAGAAGGVTVSTASLSFDEAGEGSYTLVLDTDPGGSVTVSVASDNAGVTVAPATLTFAGGADGDWNNPQSVTVASAADGDTDNESATITHTVSGYTGVTSAASVSVSVTDAGFGFVVEPSSVRVTLGDDPGVDYTVDYTLRLLSEPTGHVVVVLAARDTLVATANGGVSTVSIPAADWEAGVQISVVGIKAGSTSVQHVVGDDTTDSDYSGAEIPEVSVQVIGSNAPLLSISSDTLNVTEGGNIEFTVTSDTAAPSGGLAVSITSEQVGEFVAAENLPTSATILETATSVDVTVASVSDTDDETDGSLKLSLTPASDIRLSSNDSITFALSDDDATSVTLSGSGNIDETAGEQSLTVTLGRALVAGESLAVPLSFAGGATITTDYTLAAPVSVPVGVSYADLATTTPSITFTGGASASASATLRVVATDDSAEETDESVTVSLGALTSTSGAGLSGGASGSGTASFQIVDDDASLPTISIEAGAGVAEGNAASFTVRASSAPAANLAVNLNVGQTGDFVASGDRGSKSVTISAGSTTGSYSVTTAADTTDEPDGAATVTVTSGSGYQASSTAATASVTVSDDDQTRVTFAAPAGDIGEASGSKEMTVTLGRALVSGESLSVPLSFGGAATFGTDYTLSAPASTPSGVGYSNLASSNPSSNPPTIAFTGGAGASATATLTLNATSDDDEESDEGITVSLGTLTPTGLSGGAGGSGTASFSIIDDDDPTLPTLSITAGSEITEGAFADFTVNVTPSPAPNDIDFFYTVTQSGGDYVASAGLGAGKENSFDGGDSDAGISVQTVADSNDEPKGAITVTLSAGSGYVVSQVAGSATLNVDDNDPTNVTISAPEGSILETNGAKTITVELERALVAGEVLPVPLTFGGVAAFGADYTLAAPSPAPTGVAYSNLSSSNLTSSPPTITFTGGAGASESATVILSAEHDIADEGAAEAVTVGIGTLTSTSGTGLSGGAAGSGTASFNITDDDGTPVISITGGAGVTEGGTATFTVNANPAPQGNLSVALVVSQTGDFVAAGNLGSGKSVAIAAGVSSGAYTVATVGDNADEATGAVTVALAAGSGYDVSTEEGAASADVSVADDDATTATLSTPDAQATELDSSDAAEIRVTLGRALVDGESLEVPLAFSGGTLGTDFTLAGRAANGVAFDADAGEITFTGGSGASSVASFDLTATSDADESDETVTVSLGSLTATGLGGGASGSRSGNGQITLKDAGAQPAIDTSTTTLAMTEGAAAGEYRVKLHAAPQGTVTVTPASSDTTKATVSGAMTFSTSDWNDWQTVSVTAVNDGDVDNETVTITLAVSNYGSVTSGPEVEVSIVDRGAGVTINPGSVSLDEGIAGTYTLVLHSRPSGSVTITPQSGAASTATVGGAVTFMPATWNQPQTVQVTGVNTGSTSITHTATSADSDYNGIPVGSVSVTVGATDRVRTSSESIVVTERGAAGTYTLQLNTDPGNGATVVVTPATTSSDIGVSGSLTFTQSDWSQPQTVTVTANNDLDTEDDSATITHSVTGYGSVTQGPEISVVIKDAGAKVFPRTETVNVTVGEVAYYSLDSTATVSGEVFVRTTVANGNIASASSVPNIRNGGNSAEVEVQGLKAGRTTISHSITLTTDSRFDANDSIDSVTVIVSPTDGVKVSPTGIELEEGGSAVTYDVSLTSNPNATVTVTPGSSDTGAATVSGALTFTASDWGDAQQVTVTPVDDADTNDESVTISHTVSGYSGVTSAPSVTATITDDDRLPEISISAPSSVTEGTGVTFTVNAEPAPKSALDVELSLTASGAFVAAGDIGAQTVTIGAGAASATHTVATAADTTDEPSGSLTATLTADAAYTIAAAPENAATSSILDDDATSVSLTVPSGNIDEDGGSKTLTIGLGRALASGESLPVALAFTGAATLGTDYALAAPSPLPSGVSYSLAADPPTVTFTGPSAASATVSLSATDDSDDEGTGESVSIALGTLDSTSGTGLDGGASGSGSGAFIISDDDATAVPEISVSAGADIVEGGSASFTVSANPAPEANLDVALTVSQEGAFVAAANLGAGKTVTINATETSATYTVDTAADSDDEVDGSVELTANAGAGYTVSGSAASDSLAVSDDDATSVTLAVSDATATEGDATATASISVTLGRALVSGESLTAALSFAGGTRGQDFDLALTAATGIAFAPATNTLTFTGGASAAATANLTLTALDDDDTADDTVTVSLGTITPTGLSGGATGARTGNGEIVITDIGTPPAVIVAGSPLSITEGGAANQYTVALATDPGAGNTVVVTPTSGAPAAATVSGALTFGSSNWSNPQAITVTPVVDGNIVNETVTVTHAVTGYPGVTTAPSATVNVTDRGRGITVEPVSVSVLTGNSVDYEVVLLSQPDNNVTVTPVSGAAATASVSGSITFTPAAWDQAQSISVSGVAPGSANITHQVTSADAGYAAITPSAVSVSVSAAPGVSVLSESVAVTERGDPASYQIVLATNPGGPVQVTPVSGDPGAAAVSGALNFNALNWSTPQDVTVTPQIDNDAVSETVTISHTVSGYPGVSQVESVTANVTDFGHAILVEPTEVSAPVGETASYTLTMTSAPASPVSIARASSSTDTATVGGFAPLTANTAVTFEVTAVAEGTATVSHTIVTADPNYGSGSVPVADVTVNVTPAASVRITPVELSFDEGGAGATYSVVLGTDPGGTVVVTPGSGDAGAVTVSGALSFDSSDWSQAQTVTVSPVDDDDTDDEQVTITHTVTGYPGVSGAPDVTVAVSDDDTVRSLISVVSADAAVEEGGNATFRISAAPAPEADLVVNLAIAQQGQFADAADLATVTTTIVAGAEFANLTIATSNDSLDEPAGLLTVTLAEHEDYDLAAAPGNSASIAVEDNDATSVTLAAPSGNIPEAGGARELTLTLGRALVDGEVLPVEITFGGTATFGSDYQVSAPDSVPAGVAYSALDSTPTVTFTGGENASATASLILSAVQDSADEGDGESVSIALAALDSASGSGLGGGASASGSSAFTIEDDDRPVEVDLSAVQVTDPDRVVVDVTASLSAIQAEDVVVPVNVTLAGGAPGDVLTSASITIPAGEASARTQLVIPSAQLSDGDSVNVALGELPASIEPGDSDSVPVTVDVPEAPATLVNLSAEQVDEEGQVRLSATVTLGAEAVSDVSVPVQVTAQVNGQTTMLATTNVAVSAGGTTATANITLPEDSVADGDTVTVALGALPDGFAAGDSASVNVTIDIPEAEPTLVNLSSEQVDEEGQVRLSATVTLSVAAAADVSVPVQVTAQVNGQTTVLATIAADVSAGGTTATANITLPADRVADGDTVTVALGALPDGFAAGDSASVNVTIDIPEAPATLVNLSAEQVDDEGQVSLSATVTLSAAAAADVSVPVQVTAQGGDGQATVLATVDAAVSAGGTNATANITLPEDSVADGDTVTVALGALPDGFAAGDSASVNVTIDVPEAPPTLVNLSAEQVEEEGQVRLSATVTLSAEAAADVSVPVQVTAQGGDGQATVLATVDAAVSAGGTTATANITLPADSVADGDTVTVALGALPDGFAEGDTASVDLTVDVATLVNLSAEQVGDEGQVSLSATVTLGVAAVSDVTIPVRVTAQGGDGQATVLATVDAAVSAGGTTATANIVLPADSVADGDTVTVALGALPDGFAEGDTASVDLTVDVATLVSLSAEQVGDEGQVSLSATVTLSVAAVSDVTVPVQVTAQGGDGQATVLATLDAEVSAGGTTATTNITLPADSVADGDMVTVALGALPDGFAAGDNASVDLTFDVATLVNLSAEQAGEEGQVSLNATVTLSVAAVSDVSVPVRVTAQANGQTTVLATVDAAVSASGTTATTNITLPADSVADGDMVTVALGALPDGFAAGDNASVDLTVDVATLVNLLAGQVGEEGQVSLSATVTLSVAAAADVSVPVQVTAQATVLATVDAEVSAGGTTATTNITLPADSVADGDTVTVALGALPDGFAEGDSASTDLAVTLIPVVPMVDYAGRWWDVLDGDQREAALFGSDGAPAEAAVARRMYAQLDGRRRLLVNAVAAELYGDGMFESVGEWWQSLDCRLRLVATGEGDMADSANAYCAHYPGSVQSRILGAGEKAFVDRVGLALLGLDDIGLYPPAAFAIADASVREGPGAVLEFAVSLSEAAATAVRVDWETADGTAIAGADYTRASGTLQISAGDTSATIRVQVLEDSVDEADETLTVRLSNAVGARLTDGEALGTIMNLQAPPTAWLGRFGRTVSEQLLEGIGDRVAAKRRLQAGGGAQPAGGGAQPASFSGGSGGVSFNARIGGHSIDQLMGGEQQGLPGADLQAHYLTDGAGREQPDSLGISTSGHRQAAPFGGNAGMAGMGSGMGSGAAQPGRTTQNLGYLMQTLLSGSSFDVAGSASERSRWGVWGRGAYTRFEGSDAGMTLDGEVSTGQIGADLAYCQWLVGLSLSHSMGEGDYRQFGGAGAIESSLTAVTPYVSYGTEGFSIWAAASRGEGDITLSPAQGPEVETDIEMDMVALGLRTELLTRPNGFGLAVLSDVMMTETSSMGVTEMPGTSADASRIRLALEGSLNRSTASGGQFSVRVEGGVRQDKGDLDEGFGGELAGSLGWMQGGLTFEIKGRGLLTHESEDFMQTGVSAYLAWDSSSAATAMPSVSLRRSWGIDPDSGLDQLFDMQEMGNYGLTHAAQRLDAEFSWGLPAFANRFDSSAYLTHGMRADGQLQAIGWRLKPLAEGPGDLNLVLSATRRESSRLSSDHGVGLKIIGRW